MSYAIEIFVSHEPGSLSVSDYQGDASGSDLDALSRAITQAQAFTDQLTALRDRLRVEGLGTATPHEPLRLPSGYTSVGQLAADIFDDVFKTKEPIAREEG